MTTKADALNVTIGYNYTLTPGWDGNYTSWVQATGVYVLNPSQTLSVGTPSSSSHDVVFNASAELSVGSRNTKAVSRVLAPLLEASPGTDYGRPFQPRLSAFYAYAGCILSNGTCIYNFTGPVKAQPEAPSPYPAWEGNVSLNISFGAWYPKFNFTLPTRPGLPGFETAEGLIVSAAFIALWLALGSRMGYIHAGIVTSAVYVAYAIIVGAYGLAIVGIAVFAFLLVYSNRTGKI